MSYHRVESEDERVRDKETIRKLKKAMVDQQEERVRDKETICKLKKAMVHQQEEIATLKIEMTSLKSQMATLKSQTLVQQWSNQVMTTLCSYSIYIYISLSFFLTFFIILSNVAIYLLVILG